MKAKFKAEVQSQLWVLTEAKHWKASCDLSNISSMFHKWKKHSAVCTFQVGETRAECFKNIAVKSIQILSLPFICFMAEQVT